MKFSLCMIVKNEEAVLQDCLDSLKDIMDEIIIVDTGSTDKTKEIASNYTPYVYDYHAELQKSLEEEYGKPKDGFEWSITGDLVALGDEKMTPEDIVWTYVRSLSVLDFATAQQYSSKSVTTDRYKEYYSEITSELTDYYRDFLRKQYKKYS